MKLARKSALFIDSCCICAIDRVDLLHGAVGHGYAAAWAADGEQDV